MLTNKWKTNQWVLLTASIVSLLSIIPFGFFVDNMIIMYGVTDFGNMPANEVADILNRNIYSPAFYLPSFFIISSILINTSISAWMLNNKVKGLEKSFAMVNIVFGGLVFSLLFIIPSWFLKKHEDKEQKKYKYGFAAALGGAIISMVSSFILTFAVDGFDKATKVSTVALSLDKTKPNVIEIFSDGFDPIGMGAQIEKEEQANPAGSIYKDFYGFDKFVTAGLLTNDSFPTLMGGVENNAYNLLKEQEDNKVEGTLLDYQYQKKFGPSFKKHINETKNMNKYVINPIGLSQSTSYSNQLSGDIDYIKGLDSEIKVVNWAQAKNDNAGFLGTSRLSPDAQIYKWLNNNMSISKDSKGTRLFIEDLVTHEPTVSEEDGTIMWNSSHKGPDMKFAAINNHLKNLFTSLKNIKDSNTNAFDNSLIIVYGDHDDHSRQFIEDGYGIAGNRSFMLIKYPNDTKAKYTKIEDRAIYSPFITEIIEAGMDQSKNGVDFLKTNTNFAPDRLFATWGGPNTLFFSKFAAGNKLEFEKSVLDSKYNNLDQKNGYYHYKNDQAYLDSITNKVGWK